MISILDLKQSINNRLKKIDNINIYGNEVKEGFDRPSFFTQLFIENSDLFSYDITENDITVEIIYFGKEKTQLENIKMYEKLKKSFSLPIQIGDRKILVRKIRAEVNEILSFKFNISFYDDAYVEIKKVEPVKEIDINLRKE